VTGISAEGSGRKPDIRMGRPRGVAPWPAAEIFGASGARTVDCRAGRST